MRRIIKLVYPMLLCLLLSVPLLAQDGIKLTPAKPEIFKPLVASLQANIPDGARVKGSWYCPSAAFLPGSDANTIHIWAAPGTHVLEASGVWVKTEDVKVNDKVLPVLIDFGQYRYRTTFTIPGKQPEPEPGPNPTPQPKDPIAKVAWQLVRKVSGVTPQERQKVAAVYDGLAAEIESLPEPLSQSDLATPDKAYARLRQQLRAVLGDRLDAWAVFFDGIKPVIDQQFADGKLPKTVFGIGKACRKIAEGLK